MNSLLVPVKGPHNTTHSFWQLFAKTCDTHKCDVPLLHDDNNTTTSTGQQYLYGDRAQCTLLGPDTARTSLLDDL